MNKQAKIKRIAELFVNELRAMLNEAEYAEMVRRNHTAEYATACASHDFLDANEPMAAAFKVVARHEVDADSEADTELWNAAWNYARHHFIGQPHAMLL